MKSAENILLAIRSHCDTEFDCNSIHFIHEPSNPHSFRIAPEIEPEKLPKKREINK